MAHRTSLVRSAPLSRTAGVDVYLKLESEHPTGAFKLRGAWTFISRLTDDARSRGVITYSSGNHGQAVAWAAQRVGTRAVVVMPQTAPAIKRDGVERWGGEVVIAGTTSEDRYTRARALSEDHGYTIVPPYDDLAIIAGQGTVGLEIVEELPTVAHVAVPVGGGGLLAGVTTAMTHLAPGVRIAGVEPEGAAGLAAALAADRPVRLEHTASVADGLLPLSIGTVTFNHVRGLVDAIQVTDHAIAEATIWLHAEGVHAEPSGAATTAALRSGRLVPTGPCVLIVSGGNVADDRVRELAAQFELT